MPVTDFVGDFLTVIRNASKAHKDKVTTAGSNLSLKIAEILKEEGFILSYSKVKAGKLDQFDIHLKYHYSNPVVNEISVISKPGRRIYCGFEEIPSVKNGLGMVIISTSKGVLSDHEARVQKLGGEVLLKIF